MARSLSKWRGSRDLTCSSLPLIGNHVAEGGGPHWGDLSWPEAVANIQHASFNSVLVRLAACCSHLEGLENGIDAVDIRSLRRWASGATRAKRAAVIVAPGGAWTDQRCSEAFGDSAACSLCGGPAGMTNHHTHDCPAGIGARHAVALRRVDGVRCLLECGLVVSPRQGSRS